MTLILSGTNGLSDVDGSAATPAIRGTDANTGMFFPAADTIAFSEGGVEAMRLDSAGNMGLGVTPSAWGAGIGAMQFRQGGISVWALSGSNGYVYANAYYDGATNRYVNNGTACSYAINNSNGQHAWFTAPSGTAGNAISFTQAMTLDASGDLLVGTTSAANASKATFAFSGAIRNGFSINDIGATANIVGYINFSRSGTSKGSITYNDSTGLVSYNTTSDYRAKDISGPLTDSGAVVDSVPVYMGKMKGATQERPMFIAHEVPAYAHTGEKDAVDADGKPVYQQMDASALVPVMWAEIQSLRARVAQLEAK